MPVESWSVSAGTVDFVVRVDEKVWVGSGLFENCNSLCSTHGAVSESFDCTDWVALQHDAAGHSSTLVGWGRTCIMELSFKVFGESDFSPSLTSFWTSLKGCCYILALNFCCVFPMYTFPVLLHLIL